MLSKWDQYYIKYNTSDKHEQLSFKFKCVVTKHGGFKPPVPVAVIASHPSFIGGRTLAVKINVFFVQTLWVISVQGLNY